MANVTLTLEQKSEFFKELSSLPKATTKQIEEFLGKQDGAHYGFISEFVGAAQKGTLFDADAIYKNGNEACLTASQLDYVKGQIPLIDVNKNPTGLILDVKERLPEKQAKVLKSIPRTWNIQTDFTESERRSVSNYFAAFERKLMARGVQVYFWDEDKNPETTQDVYYLDASLYGLLQSTLQSIDIPAPTQAEKVLSVAEYNLPILGNEEIPNPEEYLFFPLLELASSIVPYGEGDYAKLVHTYGKWDAAYHVPNPLVDADKLVQYIEETKKVTRAPSVGVEEYQVETSDYYALEIQSHLVPCLVIPKYRRICDVSIHRPRNYLGDVIGYHPFPHPLSEEQIPSFMDLNNLHSSRVCVSELEQGVGEEGDVQLTAKPDLAAVIEAIAALEAAILLRNQSSDPNVANQSGTEISEDRKRLISHATHLLEGMSEEEISQMQVALATFKKDEEALNTLVQNPEGTPQPGFSIYHLAGIVAAFLAVNIISREWNGLRDGLGTWVEAKTKGFLKTHGINMNEDLLQKEKRGELNPFIVEGLEEMVRDVVALLEPPKVGIKKRAAIFRSSPGRGKTAFVEYLAYSVAKGNLPQLDGYEFWYIHADDLSGEGKLSGGAKKVGWLVDEVNKAKAEGRTIVLFIDEIHRLVDVDKHSASDISDVTERLKEHINNGDLIVLGATTDGEYAKHIGGIPGDPKHTGNPAFAERFRLFDVLEPREAALVRMVDGRVRHLERAQGVSFEREERSGGEGAREKILLVRDAIALAEAVEPGRSEPRRTIDIIEGFIDHERAAANHVLLEDLIPGAPSVTPAEETGGLKWVLQEGASLAARAPGAIQSIPSALASGASYLWSGSSQPVEEVGEDAELEPDIELSSEDFYDYLEERIAAKEADKGIEAPPQLDGESRRDYLIRRYRTYHQLFPDNSLNPTDQAIARLIAENSRDGVGQSSPPAGESPRSSRTTSAGLPPAAPVRRTTSEDGAPVVSSETLVREIRTVYGRDVFNDLGINVEDHEEIRELIEVLRGAAARQAGVPTGSLMAIAIGYEEMHSLRITPRQEASLYLAVARRETIDDARIREVVTGLDKRVRESERLGGTEREALHEEERQRVEREHEMFERLLRR